VGLVGMLISWAFDDREEKASKARKKLADRLFDNIDRMERNLGRQLGDWFHQELMGKQVNVLIEDLGALTSGLFGLADAQRNLAWTLNERLKALSRTLVNDALKQLGGEELTQTIHDTGRVPGLATMFLIDPSTSFPGSVRDGLERLLGEKIWFVVDTKNRFSVLAQAIGQGCDRRKITLEEKIQVAHVPLDDLGPVARARVRMAQQLTSLHVMR